MTDYNNKFYYPDTHGPVPDDNSFKWGVVQTDNFARETVGDKWLFHPYLRKDQAARVCEILRENCGPDSATWYKIAYLGQRLNRGMYDLV